MTSSATACAGGELRRSTTSFSPNKVGCATPCAFGVASSEKSSACCAGLDDRRADRLDERRLRGLVKSTSVEVAERSLRLRLLGDGCLAKEDLPGLGLLLVESTVCCSPPIPRRWDEPRVPAFGALAGGGFRFSRSWSCADSTGGSLKLVKVFQSSEYLTVDLECSDCRLSSSESLTKPTSEYLP